MYSRLTIIGNVGRDAELRQLDSGKQVANFSVAVNDYQEHTLWVKVVVWGNFADTVVKYAKKGVKVFVEGSLNSDDYGNPRIWNNTEGEPRTNFEMNANTVKFLSWPTDEQQSEPVPSTTEAEPIPFQTKIGVLKWGVEIYSPRYFMKNNISIFCSKGIGSNTSFERAFIEAEKAWNKHEKTRDLVPIELVGSLEDREELTKVYKKHELMQQYELMFEKTCLKHHIKLRGYIDE